MNSTRRLLAPVAAILVSILWILPFLGMGDGWLRGFEIAYLIVLIVLEIASYVLAGKGAFRMAGGIFKYSLHVFIIPFNLISLYFGCAIIWDLYVFLPIIPVAVAVLKRR